MSRRRKPWIRRDRDVTPADVYADRRQILGAMATAGLLPAAALRRPQDPSTAGAELFRAPKGTYPARRNPEFAADRPLTAERVATGYNNFYEFSTDKERVKEVVTGFDTAPWKVRVDGLVERPGVVDLEDFFRRLPSEERVYRFRCVEAWAMTVPWTGFPMRRFLEWVRPKPAARYVAFETFVRPEQAPGQALEGWYEWPYHEALTLEEAGNELTLLAHGLYGKELPRQNGAPLRLIVPWKYGLKNIKSIVRIRFVAKRPATFWNALQPDEYSWLSNVEPDVPHPRWSQAEERLIPDGRVVPTRPYNGYADHVAALYDR